MRQSVCTCVVLVGMAVLLASLPQRGDAYSSMGPYELMLMADRTDYLVVGDVVGTEEADTSWGNRVSLVRADRVLFGASAAGDTFSVYWRTRHADIGDGWVGISTEPGPQLSDAVGPHVWLFAEVDGALRVSGYPVRLSRGSLSTLEQYRGWAQESRRPYAGIMSDPAKAREHGYDPERGDVVRGLLAAYLSGYLEALGEVE